MTTFNYFITWASNGITKVGQLWNGDRGKWHTIPTLQRLTRSKSVPVQHALITDQLTWIPHTALPYSVTDWWTVNIRGTILEVFHIHRVHEGSLYGAKYISTPHEELELVYTGIILLEDNAVRRIRVVTRKGVDGPFFKFNPSQPIQDSTTV
jgi:hypothetical protein